MLFYIVFNELYINDNFVANQIQFQLKRQQGLQSRDLCHFWGKENTEISMARWIGSFYDWVFSNGGTISVNQHSDENLDFL